MKVLVTRPREDAAAFARLLNENGFDPVTVPLIDIAFSEEAMPAIPSMAALAITSANGVRAVARRTTNRNWPVYAVGPASTAAAKEAGFEVAGEANSSVESLAEIISASAGNYQEIIHIAGSHRAGDLVGLLERKGLKAKLLVLYQAKQQEKLPPDLLAQLQKGEISAATFFSPRTARIFLTCLEAEKATKFLENLPIICLSGSIASVFEKTPAKKVFAAKSPDQTGMIDILKSALT